MRCSPASTGLVEKLSTTEDQEHIHRWTREVQQSSRSEDPRISASWPAETVGRGGSLARLAGQSSIRAAGAGAAPGVIDRNLSRHLELHDRLLAFDGESR